MTVLSIFSSSITIASSMYGVSARLTRKPGEDLHRQRQPVDGADKGQRLLQQLRVGAVMADDLDELQPRHRIEEVQPEQPLGLLQRGAQILQRNARRVGGEDRARLHLRLEPGIDLLLQLQLFRHRLDDEIGVADALGLHVRHQPVERVAHIGALAHDLAEQIGGALDRAGDRLRLHVGKRHPHDPGRRTRRRCRRPSRRRR